MLKLREATGDSGKDGEDGAEADIDEAHSVSGEMGTQRGGGASAWAVDGGDAGKGPGGGVLTSDGREVGDESRGGSPPLEALGLTDPGRIRPGVR